MTGIGTITAAEIFSEQIELKGRTTDPANAEPGEYWIRTDQTSSGPDVVAELRRQDNSGVTKIPLFASSEESNLGSDVVRGPSVVLDDGTVGFVAMSTDSGAAFGSPRALNSAGDEYLSHDALKLAAIPDSGVARWTFDNDDTSSGTALDVWNNNDGTIKGATTGVSGANQTYTTNEAYSFDGDDSVAFGDIYDAANNSFSVAGWFLVDSYSGFNTIIANEKTAVNYQHILRVEADGNLYFYHNNSSSNDIISVSGPSTGTWAFAFAFYDAQNDTIGLSLNAGSRTTESAGSPQTSSVDNWAAGEQPNAGGDYWVGDLDELRVYNKVLSTTEESNLYNNGSI